MVFGNFPEWYNRLFTRIVDNWIALLFVKEVPKIYGVNLFRGRTVVIMSSCEFKRNLPTVLLLSHLTCATSVEATLVLSPGQFHEKITITTRSKVLPQNVLKYLHFPRRFKL